MTTATNRDDTFRWILRLTGNETFADELGDIGCWVGPRTGPIKRTKGQKEDYVLRRLLVAWRKAGELPLPVTLYAEKERPREPDFLLAWDDDRTLGVEVTEAGSQDYQKWLTETEPAREAGLTEGLERDIGNASDRARDDYVRAIARKLKDRAEGAYRSPDACDLAIYDNTATGGFIDKRDLLRDIASSHRFAGQFNQIHLISGTQVYLDILSGRPRRFDLINTYETDYAGWIFDQMERLRRSAQLHRDGIDAVNIAEELGDLGRSERRSVQSHLENLLVHLLKWQFQSERRSNGWRYSIDEARDRIFERLKESPSLRPWLWSRLDEIYERARTVAARETKLPREKFPKDCPYDKEEIADPHFISGNGN